jgi:tetratricopeptide (TPR) repeat protein
LLQAKVLEVAEVKVEEKDRSKVFKKFRKEAHEAMRTAEEYYRSDAPQMSIQIYRKWINKLEDFRMQSDEEEKIQKKMLIKMYQNAAVCYNAIGKPEKTCIMIRQLEKLTSIKGNYKALLEKGRANMMLNDFLFARKHLKAAATIEPGKESIHFALRELDEREMAEINYRKQQEKILLEMEAKVKIHEAEMKKKAEKEYEEQEEFRKKLEEMKVATEAKIEQFKQKGFDKMVLFKGIDTEEESEMISQLCKEHQVSLKGFSSIDGASTTYFLVKNS